MPDYRYYAADLLTGNVIGDLELYGVTCNKRLNQAGTLGATTHLTGNSIQDSITVEATQPGRTALYMERDGELIWGGILWTRLYNNTVQGFQINAQTFESYFDHVVFEQHFVQQNVEQQILFQNMVNALQASVNIGLEFITPLPDTNIPRTVLLPNYEFHFGNDALQQLVGIDLGLEYTIKVENGVTVDHPRKRIQLGYPQIGSANPEMHFDFPGTVSQYWIPESAAQSGAKFGVLGYGGGDKVARSVAIDQNTINAGYPAWWIVNNYSMIADLQILKDKAHGDAKRLKMPFTTPQFELHPQVNDQFTGWNNLGDAFSVHVEDIRFPNGKDFITRMIGWDLTPASATSSESLRFTVEGE